MKNAMKCIALTLTASFSACSLIGAERLTVSVVDNSGAPISGATLWLKTMNKSVLFGSDNAKDFDTYNATSDAMGRVTIAFNCINGAFTWQVSAPGYYEGNVIHDEFRCDDAQSSRIILLEHEKRCQVKLWRRINPCPMHARGLTPNIKVPKGSGRYGFDLKLGDWVRPFGGGTVADFYVNKVVENDGGLFKGYIDFDEGCGGYVAKKTGCNAFPSTYCANTNAQYFGRFEFRGVETEITVDNALQQGVLRPDEYMVLRTRVIVNENGRMISSNYSKIIGPFQFDLTMRFQEYVYNPIANDPNLELDPSRNLLGRFKKYAFAP